MTTPVLICDDSSMARKQMARALPPGWDVEVSFAQDGVEGVAAIKAGKGEILFLDLNMPEMDGYEVLQAIRSQDLETMVIVVSGDIQPEAHERVMRLGALAFIQKPVTSEQIRDILEQYGIQLDTIVDSQEIDFEVSFLDACQEIANVAMGRAGDLLARLLNAFVVLPIPNVKMIEMKALRQALEKVEENDTLSAVCQGFIGAGIAGEALLVFNEASFADMADLMKYKGEIDDAMQLELLMDVSSILLGACLAGIADQLDVSFSQSYPVVLGRHIKVRNLLKGGISQWERTLAIEIAYSIEGRQINCDLLLLFTEDSIQPLKERLFYLVD